MAFFKSIIRNAGQLSKQILPGSPIVNNEVGLAGVSYSTQQDPNDREAIYPNWFFSARLGQPRGVDTRKLRNLAQSPWSQMVINTFKKQVETTDWRIVPEDEEDDSDHKADIEKCMEFFQNVNDNAQTISDVNSEIVTDISEIDAGCVNYVYSNASYVIGEIPVYNAWGQVISTESGLVLNPLGQRELVKMKAVDGSTMLKQVDIHKNLLNFWQYSFKHPRQNPTRFEKDEIAYLIENQRSYDVYGFSPMQSVQQVIELLVQGTRYNKDLYLNNAIPDILISLPKLSKSELNKLKRKWNNSYKGKPHQVGFINWMIDKIEKLNSNNRDLEWLDGQKWYFKLVFGAYGVSPTEAGFFENSNKSNDEGQERVTVRNALKPKFQKLSQLHTRKTITEILQKEDHGLMFKFFPKDQAAEKIEFEQDMQELDRGAMTINDYRKKTGRESYEWGDDPLKRPFDPATSFTNFGEFGNPNPNPVPDNSKEQNKDITKHKNQNSQQAALGSPPILGKTDESLAAGDDILDEADGYSDFLLKFFNMLEKKVLRAVNKIDVDKSYMRKTLGEFLRDMFNIVNTTAFAANVKRYIKIDLMNGLISAEAELNMDIGLTEAYKNKINVLASQQIDGYLINGKKWPGIKGVTKELQADIIRIVQGGIQEHRGHEGIKKDISEKFDVFSDWRSNMIARTETTRIINEGKIIGYKESGIPGKKVWSSAMDNRTSPICQRLNGQVIDIDTNFIDPVTRKAYSAPPAHVNCRSTIFFRSN